MSKYSWKITFSNGEILESDEDMDGIYYSEDEAYEGALQAISECNTGKEILYMSNPGDYDEPDDDEDYEIEIIEF